MQQLHRPGRCSSVLLGLVAVGKEFTYLAGWLGMEGRGGCRWSVDLCDRGRGGGGVEGVWGVLGGLFRSLGASGGRRSRRGWAVDLCF